MPRSRTVQGCLISLLFVLEVLVTVLSQEKEKKSVQIGKKGVKLSMFIHAMIVYTENSKESTTKLFFKKSPGTNK
jgi:hypothetical protein